MPLSNSSFLSWPFFEDRHRALAGDLEAWCERELADIDHHDVDTTCKTLVSSLGAAGWLQHTAPDVGNPTAQLDVRTLAICRETLARYNGLADFAFAMQGLGAGPISLYGSPEQRADWLPRTRSGAAIAAFALTEPASGSDVANIATTARRDGTQYVIDGEKTWISNGGNRRRLRPVCSNRRAGGQRTVRIHSACQFAGAEHRRTAACHSPTPSRPPPVRWSSRAGKRTPRQRRRRLPDRDGNPRCLPLHRRRGGPWLCSQGPRSGSRACRAARAVRITDGGAANGPGAPGRYGARGRRRGTSRLSRRLDQGSRRSPRDPRGCDGQAVRYRGSPTHHRPVRATSWWRRRQVRPSCRNALSGNQGTQNL